jgi:hypothetical protein
MPSIGMVRVRHYLNDKLRIHGGHIGFFVRRDQRGKGYAKEALRLALIELCKLGEERALLTVDTKNASSIRVIESNGGRFESVDTDSETGRPFLRYWIEMKPQPSVELRPDNRDLPMKDLRSEAEGIIRDLGLVELLSKHGEAAVVGSVALDLIVKRDIDVHLLIRGGNLLSVADDVYHALLGHDGIREVRISDYRAKGGMKIGVDSFSARSGEWSIDVWITDRPETTGFALVERLKGTLTAAQRRAVLRIKRHFHARGQLRDGLSTRIYAAVVDDGIRTVEAFQSLMKRKTKPQPAGPGGTVERA